MRSIVKRSPRRGGVLKVAIIVVTMSGCSFIPERQPLGVPMPERFSFNVDTGAGSTSGTWWEGYNDPALNDIIAVGLAQSPIMQSARAGLEVARHDATAAGIGVAGDATATVNTTGGGSSTRSVGLGAELLPFGRRNAELANADARYNAARNAFLDTQRLFIRNTATEYVNLRYFQALLVVRQDEQRLARSSIDAAVSRGELGASTEIDELDARAYLADVQVRIASTEASIAEHRHRLAGLLGVTPDNIPAVLRHSGAQPVPGGASDIGVPADLLRNRPDVRRAEFEYETALADIGEARANRYPSLSLNGTIRSTGSGDPSLGLGLSLPVFTQPTLAAEEDAAGARADLALAEWRNIVIQAVNEVELALAGISSASQGVAASRRSERLHTERVALLRNAFETAQTFTLVDVIEADQELARSREQTLSATRTLGLEYLALWTALGCCAADTDTEVVAQAF